MNPQPNFNRSLHPILNPDFVCDICGLPGIRNMRVQKRHEGRCAAIGRARAKVRSAERIKRRKAREVRREK